MTIIYERKYDLQNIDTGDYLHCHTIHLILSMLELKGQQSLFLYAEDFCAYPEVVIVHLSRHMSFQT